MGYFKYQARDIRVTARFALIGCGQCGATAILTVYQFCPASGLCEELRCIGICQDRQKRDGSFGASLMRATKSKRKFASSFFR